MSLDKQTNDDGSRIPYILARAGQNVLKSFGEACFARRHTLRNRRPLKMRVNVGDQGEQILWRVMWEGSYSDEVILRGALQLFLEPTNFLLELLLDKKQLLHLSRSPLPVVPSQKDLLKTDAVSTSK